MNHYLFIDDNSGEEFIVGASTIGEATLIAIEEFGEEVRYQCRLTDMEAEASGLDEY